MIELILAICLSRIQYISGRFNEKAIWNGYGSIESTLNKTADAPMAYRVLLPWIFGLMNGNLIERYEIIRFALMWIMLLSVNLVWGLPVMLVFCVLLTATLWYNYWDFMPEVIGITLAMSGNIYLALFGIIIHAMSRETFIIDAPVFVMVSNNWLAGYLLLFVAVYVYLIVRYIQGEHPLYCKRWMITDNYKMIITPIRPYLLYAPYISIGLCALALSGAWIYGQWVGLLVPVMVIAGLTMARINETRVFTSVLPFAAWLIARFA